MKDTYEAAELSPDERIIRDLEKIMVDPERLAAPETGPTGENPLPVMDESGNVVANFKTVGDSHAYKAGASSAVTIIEFTEGDGKEIFNFHWFDKNVTHLPKFQGDQVFSGEAAKIHLADKLEKLPPVGFGHDSN